MASGTRYENTIDPRSKEQKMLDTRAQEWGFANEAERVKQVNKIISAFGQKKSKAVTTLGTAASKGGGPMTAMPKGIIT